jgi:CheY-like chemotaxis protein
MVNQWPTVLGRLRVLIVEDRPDGAYGLERLTHWLLDLGCDTDVCRTDPEAVERVGGFRPHVVFLDVALLTRTGLALVLAIRHIAGLEQPLIVAITASDGSDNRERCEWAGIDLHIHKPVQLSDLVFVLTEAGWSRVLGSVT